jgi:RimJ/RimL family protein N-acetyltransferase
MQFYEEKDLAVCGLACVLCREENCQGCKARGKAQGSECGVYNCAISKGLDGCYQCDDFPCHKDMLQGTRNRAFNQYAKQYGKKALLERLKTNYENGITYHKSDGLTGDYDLLETEDDVLRLLRFGTNNPYVKCPELHTEHFTLRRVMQNDVEDLLKCYCDPKTQKLFNSANCNTDFCFKSTQEMQEYMGDWIAAYENQEFIRFAIVDKITQKAVGTIEMFGLIGKYKTECGILRVDICSEYETELYLTELITLCVNEFFLMFGVSYIVTLAVSEAEKRINSLLKIGFSMCDAPKPEYNYIYEKR